MGELETAVKLRCCGGAVRRKDGQIHSLTVNAATDGLCLVVLAKRNSLCSLTKNVASQQTRYPLVRNPTPKPLSKTFVILGRHTRSMRRMCASFWFRKLSSKCQQSTPTIW